MDNPSFSRSVSFMLLVSIQPAVRARTAVGIRNEGAAEDVDSVGAFLC